MRLDIVREFLFLAKSMNYTQAATSLHMTQSCLSKHMIELEEETGLHLFSHEVSKPSLTETGKMFFQDFSLIISEIDAAICKCKELQENAKCSLRIQDASLSAVMDYVYNAARQYRLVYPNALITFDVIETQKSVQEALRLDVIDVGVDCVSSNCIPNKDYESDMLSKGFRALRLHTEPLVVWTTNESPFLNKEYLGFDQIKGAPIVTSSGKVFDSIQRALVQIFDSEHVAPRFKKIHFEGTNDRVAYFLLTNLDEGLFFTTSKMASEGFLQSRDDISHRVMDDPRFITTMYVLARNDNSCANEFLDFVQMQLPTQAD